MMLAWMIYATALTLVLAIAGRALEHGARALRKPARFVVIATMLVATVIAGIGSVSQSQKAAAVSVAPLAIRGRSDPANRTPPTTAAKTAAWPALTTRSSVTLPEAFAIFDVPLIALWILASLVWATILAGSALRLRRQRVTWREDIVDGAPVYISHDVGPALFGLFRYSVVVPRWVFALGAEQRALVLAHEREHARAGDPLLLLAGAMLVLLQPWNLGTWLLFQRLRLAIEVDCDARVIARSLDLRSYGELLLDIGERMLPGAAPVIALSEPHSHLERRIATMTARPLPRPVLRTIVSLGTACVLIIAACQLPRPALSRQSHTQSIPSDFVQYRWVAGDNPAEAPVRREAEVLGDTVILDIGGIDSARVTPYAAGVDSTWIVLAKLNAHGASAIGAATATHIGHRIAVIIDGKVVAVATVSSPLGTTIPIVSDVSRAYADSIARRVNRAADALRPMQPVVFQRGEARPMKQSDGPSWRTIVKITRVGLANAATPPTILVYTSGRALVGIGDNAPSELKDTLRLSSLPAMTLDVSDGDVHLQLLGGGTMRIDADVTGGRALRFSGEGTSLTVLRRGIGIRTD